jgi:hypothetical protein
MATASSGPTPIALIANTNPVAISYKQTITLSTLDQNNSNAPIAEGYIVSGPACPGVTPIFIAGGTKAVIPLSTASGTGAPYLKIHFPVGSGNKLYMTYCVANPYMSDGYYDYKTGVPTAYYNALRAWINLVPSLATGGPILKTRSLKFSAYGNATNKPANSVTFYINLQGTFGALSLSTSTFSVE